MNYRNLGKHGVRVSEVSLGSWITYGGTTDEATAATCIQKAFDLGINFFDTADVYENGAAETVLAAALAGVERKDYVLATKCYFPMSDRPNDCGLSRKHIVESVHASLRRLRTDYIDLYQCHRWDTDTPLEETLSAMDDLIRQGKILYWGTSMWTAEQLADACDLAAGRNRYPPASDQPCYNMLKRDVETDGRLAFYGRERLGVVIFSPLAQGVLTGKYLPGAPPPAGSRATFRSGARFIGRMVADRALLVRVQALVPIAQDLGCSMSQLALAWVLRRPEVSCVIIGASRPEQIEDNVEACDVRLTEAVLSRIDEALK